MTFKEQAKRLGRVTTCNPVHIERALFFNKDEVSDEQFLDVHLKLLALGLSGDPYSVLARINKAPP